MLNSTTTCLQTVKAKYPDLSLPIKPDAFSEVSNDDGEAIGFKGFGNNNQDPVQKEKWKKETNKLAWYSIYSHITELPIKFLCYYICQAGDKESLFSKSINAAGKLASTLGGMFRNLIYKREDDVMGFINEANKNENFGDKKSQSLTKLNLNTQIFGRFLVPALTFINPSLASDIDNAIIGPLDSSWFRAMSINTGFYPGMLQDLFTKWSPERKEIDKENLPSFKFIFQQFKNHCSSAKKSWNEYKNTNEQKDKKLLSFCKYADQATSIIMPFICIPSNILGDTIRPIARRLELTGFFRNAVRVLSVADRSLLGINYVFRYFIPERIRENQKGITTPFKASNLYAASLLGDILDLPLTIFEDKIKEGFNFIKHRIEIMRIVKNTLFNAFWAGRRVGRTAS